MQGECGFSYDNYTFYEFCKIWKGKVKYESHALGRVLYMMASGLCPKKNGKWRPEDFDPFMKEENKVSLSVTDFHNIYGNPFSSMAQPENMFPRKPKKAQQNMISEEEFKNMKMPF
jgi:hypothetical protein